MCRRAFARAGGSSVLEELFHIRRAGCQTWVIGHPEQLHGEAKSALVLIHRRRFKPSSNFRADQDCCHMPTSVSEISTVGFVPRIYQHRILEGATVDQRTDVGLHPVV